MSIAVPMQGFGGGVRLNFKIVGNPKPTNPKENTIWLNTDVEITGSYFRTTQPENMAEGEVWINTGIDSKVSFDVLKKNNITVYPVFAKQMTSGELVSVPAQSYINGNWVDWYNGELFKNGNQYADITGGWTNDGYYYYGSSYTKVTPVIGSTISMSADYRNIGDCCVIGTKNPIDLRNRTKIYVDVVSATGNCFIAVTNSNKNLYPSSAIAVAALSPGTVELDVSSIDGSFYIGAVAVSGSELPVVGCELSEIRLS